MSIVDIVSDDYSEPLLPVVHVDLHNPGNVAGQHNIRGILAWVKVSSICVFNYFKHFYLQVLSEPGKSLSNLLVHSAESEAHETKSIHA